MGEQKSKMSPSKNNDDIPLAKGRYQTMVKERWGEQRRIDSRIGEEKFSKPRVSGFSQKKDTEEQNNKNNREHQLGSYASLPGQKASVVLRQKHAHLAGQGREGHGHAVGGVFSLPRVS